MANRFERLVGILGPAGQLDVVQTALRWAFSNGSFYGHPTACRFCRQLAEIKDTMEADLKRKLPARLAGAQYRLEVLDIARSQINDLITDTLVSWNKTVYNLPTLNSEWAAATVGRPWNGVAGPKPTQAVRRKCRFACYLVVSVRSSMLAQLQIIPEHEIVSQESAQSVTTRTVFSSPAAEPIFEIAGNSEYSITTCRRIGYFGSLRVSYRTFSSPSDNVAAEVLVFHNLYSKKRMYWYNLKRTKMELRLLSNTLYDFVFFHALLMLTHIFIKTPKYRCRSWCDQRILRAQRCCFSNG